jgi:hypothetical protein
MKGKKIYNLRDLRLNINYIDLSNRKTRGRKRREREK